MLLSQGTVPRPLNRCIGRQREVKELQKLLSDSRLVTLSGPGGIGKTRLSLELAGILSEKMEVCFLSLGTLLGNQSLLGALGQALDLADGEAPGFLARLRQLSSDPWLCILDSFEHLLEQAPVVTEMLAQIPQLRILVTSRSALRIGGEQVYPIGPLEVKTDSAELFVERARAVRSDFQVAPAQESTLTEICGALEGLPLALELAASRLEILTLEEVNARLSQKLQLLEAGAHDAPPRHRTIRAAIAWSHDLLDGADRQLFRRLSVFSGGFSLEQMQEEPFAGTLDAASRLLRHNLLRRAENAAGTTRLFFMELIREFALEQLRSSGEEAGVRKAFCRLNLQLAEKAREKFGGSEQARAVRELAEEQENLSASLSGSDPEVAARLVTALGFYWESSGHLAEGLRWARQALTSLPLDSPLRAGPLEVAGTMARHQGDYALARQFYGEALEIDRPAALRHLAETDYRQGFYEKACEGYRESLLGAHGEAEISARLGLGRSLWALGQDANALLAQCLADSQRHGWLRQAGWSHNSMGEVARTHRRWEEATEHFKAGAAIFEQLSDSGPRAILLQNLAFVQLAQENWEQAAVGLREAFLHWFRGGSQHGLGLSLVGLARLALHRKETATAHQLASLGRRILAELDGPLDPSDRSELAAVAELPQKADPLVLDEFLVDKVARLTAPPAPPKGGLLTGRESEVLKLLAEGLSNLAIAESLHISRHTVTVHLRTIYDKLGVHSRSAATRWALDQRST